MSEHSPVVLRVGTADRTTVARDLIAHHRAGLLDRSELDVRLALAAAARTEDDLRRVTLDLPDVAPVRNAAPIAAGPEVASARQVALARAERHDDTLGVATDVTVMLVTMAAFICTALLFAVTSGAMRGDERVVLALAAFGSFSVGAGSIHLAHRVFRRTGQRG